jgi:hypothetical protein
MTDMAAFVLFVLGICTAGIVWYRRTAYRESLPYRVADIGIAFAAVLIIAAAMIFVASFFDRAHAQEVEWFPSAEVFIGTEHAWRGEGIFCYQDEGNWVGNLGARVGVIGYGRFSVDVQQIHHSCAFTSDANSGYDATGVSARFRVW